MLPPALSPGLSQFFFNFAHWKMVNMLKKLGVGLWMRLCYPWPCPGSRPIPKLFDVAHCVEKIRGTRLCYPWSSPGSRPIPNFLMLHAVLKRLGAQGYAIPISLKVLFLLLLCVNAVCMSTTVERVWSSDYPSELLNTNIYVPDVNFGF